MIDDILIFDDFIPKWYQDEIERILFEEAQWMLKYDITYSKENFDFLLKSGKKLKPRPGFNHALFASGQVVSPIHLFLKPMLYTGCEKINVNLQEVLLGRSFLQLPLSNPDHFDIKDPLHVDGYYDHLVFLYYVVSSDGQTLITDYTHNPSDSIELVYEKKYTENLIDVRYEDCNIIKRVTPKKGRLVLFNGKHYHAGEQSKDSIRCVINYNLKVCKNETF